MRIIGGKWRGIKLGALGEGDRAAHLRPSSDRLRESVFNILASPKLDFNLGAARVLDLFAGSGALGLEALSRGATSVDFVENGQISLRLLTANIDRLGAMAAVRIHRLDATKLPAPAPTPFDLIFLDPPYGRGLGEHAIASALVGGYFAPSALVLWEEATPPRLPPELKLVDRRKIGQSWVTLAKCNP